MSEQAYLLGKMGVTAIYGRAAFLAASAIVQS